MAEQQKIIAPPPGMPAMPTEPALLKRWEKLLDLQITKAEEEAEHALERKRLKEVDRAARLANATAARKSIDAIKFLQSRCSHMKEGGKTALGAQHHLPDTVTQKAKMSVICVRCGMIDEGTPQEIEQRWGNKLPSPQVIGSISTHVDY